MKARFLTILSGTATVPKVKHYVGVPPELTGGKDTRQKMGFARFLVIEENQDGAFLYRYDAKGDCVGDTWHLNTDDAKHQATYEYEDLVQDWQNIPSEVEDAVLFGLARMNPC
jgi:hypothetical protein